MIARCGPPPLARALVPLEDWSPVGRGERLVIPPPLHAFKSGAVCASAHCHPPESVRIGQDYLIWSEGVGPSLIAVTEPPHYMLWLVTRAGRVLRALRIKGADPLEDPERYIEKRARAIETAQLAVRTLRERRVLGRRSVSGEAWLRQQLAGLETGGPR